MSEVTYVCVHGVGLWPTLFDSLDLGSKVRLVVRPGYDTVSSVDGFGDQVAVVAEAIHEAAPSVVVGVSGGATLALACASRRVDGLVGAVSHEPLVGALAPELDVRVANAGADLEAAPSEKAALEFVSGLYGAESWKRIPEAGRDWARRHASTICRDVGLFSSYQPPADALASLTVPHLTTVGSVSAPVRHDIAHLLGALGSSTAVVEGSGHLVLIDQPARFASLIHQFTSEISSCT